MMKGSDQIFPGAQVDPGLAADGGVHLREHRGGNLYQVDAAHVERGQQAGNVAYDAASESNDDGISVRAQAAQLLGQFLNRGQLFVAFAIGHFQNFRGNPAAEREAGQFFSPLAADGRDGDDEQALMFRGRRLWPDP